MREASSKDERYWSRSNEIILARKDHGQMGFGVGIELAESMEFGEDIES